MDAWALLASGHNSEEGLIQHHVSSLSGPEVLRGLNESHQWPLATPFLPTRTIDRSVNLLERLVEAATGDFVYFIFQHMRFRGCEVLQAPYFAGHLVAQLPASSSCVIAERVSEHIT